MTMTLEQVRDGQLMEAVQQTKACKSQKADACYAIADAIDAAIRERDELRAECNALRTENSTDFRDRVLAADARAEKAEAELAKLKERIVDAPVQVYGRDDWHEPLIGKRVALVKVED